MKKMLLVALTLLLAGCSNAPIAMFMIARAQELCSTNGGLDFVEPITGIWHTRDGQSSWQTALAKCRNGVKVEFNGAWR